MRLNFANNSIFKDLSNVLFGAQFQQEGQVQGPVQDGESKVDKTFADYLALAVAASTSAAASRHAFLTDPISFMPEKAEIELVTMNEQDANIESDSDDPKQSDGGTKGMRELVPLDISENLEVVTHAPSFWRHSFALSVIEPDHELTEVSLPENHELTEVSLPENHELTEVSLPENHELTEVSLPENRALIEVSLPENRELIEAALPEYHEVAKVSLTENHKQTEVPLPEKLQQSGSSAIEKNNDQVVVASTAQSSPSPQRLSSEVPSFPKTLEPENGLLKLFPEIAADEKFAGQKSVRGEFIKTSGHGADEDHDSVEAAPLQTEINFQPAVTIDAEIILQQHEEQPVVKIPIPVEQQQEVAPQQAVAPVDERSAVAAPPQARSHHAHNAEPLPAHTKNLSSAATASVQGSSSDLDNRIEIKSPAQTGSSTPSDIKSFVQTRSSTPSDINSFVQTRSNTPNNIGLHAINDPAQAIVSIDHDEPHRLLKPSGNIEQKISTDQKPSQVHNAQVTVDEDAGRFLQNDSSRGAKSTPARPVVRVSSQIINDGNEETQRLRTNVTIDQRSEFSVAGSNIKVTPATAPLNRNTSPEESSKAEFRMPLSLDHASTASLSDASSTTREAAVRNLAQGPLEKSAAPLVNAKDFVGWVVNRATMISNDGRMEVELRLEPESLGAVKIKMVIVGDNLTSSVEVQNVQAKELVESRLPALQHKLLENGIRAERIEVTLAVVPMRAEAPSTSTFDMKNSWQQSPSQGQRQPTAHRQPTDRQTRKNGQSSFLDLMG